MIWGHIAQHYLTINQMQRPYITLYNLIYAQLLPPPSLGHLNLTVNVCWQVDIVFFKASVVLFFFQQDKAKPKMLDSLLEFLFFNLIK